jgi:hypothetical protein
MTDTLKIGERVTCAYRGQHQGTVLARDDPRAWAGTLAFPEEKPDPEAVQAHVKRHTPRLNDKHPVLWDTFSEPRVYWDSQLQRI